MLISTTDCELHEDTFPLHLLLCSLAILAGIYELYVEYMS